MMHLCAMEGYHSANKGFVACFKSLNNRILHRYSSDTPMYAHMFGVRKAGGCVVSVSNPCCLGVLVSMTSHFFSTPVMVFDIPIYPDSQSGLFHASFVHYFCCTLYSTRTKLPLNLPELRAGCSCHHCRLRSSAGSAYIWESKS
jgi:hypothetical protein